MPLRASWPVAEIPEPLAFGAAECADFNNLQIGATIEDLVPPHAQHDIGPISEYLAATDAIGQAAGNEFDRAADSIRSGEVLASEDSDVEALNRIERLVQASTSPELISSSAQLAERIQQDCDDTDLAVGLWEIHREALFMQAIPPTGYCEALAGSGLESLDALEALAPDAHREWIDALQSVNLADESSLALALGAEAKASWYRSAQCGEDLADLD